MLRSNGPTSSRQRLHSSTSWSAIPVLDTSRGTQYPISTISSRPKSANRAPKTWFSTWWVLFRSRRPRPITSERQHSSECRTLKMPCKRQRRSPAALKWSSPEISRTTLAVRYPRFYQRKRSSCLGDKQSASSTHRASAV